MSKLDKRTQILNATIRCIAKHGLEHTNAQVVAKEMGIAQSGIFYHFPRQQMLFDALAAHIAQQNHQLVTRLVEKRKPKTNVQKLFTHIEGNFQWAEMHPDQAAVLLLSIARTSVSPSVQKTISQLFAVGEDRIYHYLAAAVAENELRLSTSIRDAARFVHKALMGMLVSYHYAGAGRKPSKEHCRLLKHHLKLLFAPPAK